MTGFAHGTVGGYTNHDCRCEPCREARRAYLRDYKARGGGVACGTPGCPRTASVRTNNGYCVTCSGGESIADYWDGGKLIRRALARNGMTQAELSQHLGLNRASMTNFIRGYRSLPPRIALGLEKVLNINAEVLMDADGRARLARARGQEPRPPGWSQGRESR